MQNKKKRRRLIAAGVLLLLANVVVFITLWMLKQYDQVLIDQFLYQLKASSEGVQKSLAVNAVAWVGGFSLVLTAAGIGLWLLLSGGLRYRLRRTAHYASYCTSWVCVFFKRHALLLSGIALACSFVFFLTQMGVPTYVGTAATESDFIEQHYADPNSVSVTFPEQKRNLIYIFLESMENTFADPAAGGCITADYIPELSALAANNINFSHTNGLGGARSYTGTTWTASAMTAQTSGTPVKIHLAADAYGNSPIEEENVYLPGVVSIGEILQKAGYAQTLLVGSDADFHGRKEYFEGHGNYHIVDTESLKAEGRLPQEYSVWWGFEDEKLFTYAKEEITKLAGGDKPFNFTMLTVDTHFPSGYVCSACQKEYPEQYANVLACSSRQVYAFVEWIKAQPFYENTTIVISGDHRTMDPQFMADIEEDYVRTIYNCIINAPLQPVKEKGREFATFDMYPTTLAALGATIEGDRLALGTNLFSEKPTLAEQYGCEVLEKEILKKSVFYNEKILGVKTQSTTRK